MSLLPTAQQEFLTQLLTQRFPQAAGMVGQTAPVTDEQGITVSGQQPQVQREPAPVRYDLSNLDNIRSAQDVQTQLQQARGLPSDDPQKIAQHKGMFGMKGTLRDILGTLGDAFLTQAGKQTVYRPQRQNEMMADGAAGFTTDPLGAAERLASIPGGMEMAQKMQQQAENADLRRLQQEGLAQSRQSMEEKRSLDNRAKGLTIAAQMLSAGVSSEVVSKFARDYGLDDETISSLGSGTAGMTVNQQRRLPLEEQRVGIAKQNADANTKRANRPPAGRAAPRPTAGNIDAEILQKVRDGTATPAEQQIYQERLVRGGGRSGRRTGQASTGKLRIRNGTLAE